MFFSMIIGKKMLFKIVLGNLERKIFFGTQPWWTTFKLRSVVIFVIIFRHHCFRYQNSRIIFEKLNRSLIRKNCQ